MNIISNKFVKILLCSKNTAIAVKMSYVAISKLFYIVSVGGV